ncbi:MAG: hypothetical protein J7513_12970 [Solirubrobacteraceae bacterium]|nr:hypothetical protein [Solirubrobacteraceae bacterium]
MARIMLGWLPAGLLAEGIIGDRHDHAVAWILVAGVLFGTALWIADRLSTLPISAGRWWLVLAAVHVPLLALPQPADLVLAAVTLAALTVIAARAPRHRVDAATPARG